MHQRPLRGGPLGLVDLDPEEGGPDDLRLPGFGPADLDPVGLPPEVLRPAVLGPAALVEPAVLGRGIPLRGSTAAPRLRRSPLRSLRTVLACAFAQAFFSCLLGGAGS